MRKIVVGTPWVSAFMHTQWVDAALNLRSPTGYCVEWIRGLGWCDARRIHYIIEHALESDADVIAFIDGDVIVEPDWLESMTQHVESGYRVVASVVPMRGRALERFSPFEPMAWNVSGTDLVPIDPRDGLQPVDYASFGAICFDANVFREIEPPWSGQTYNLTTYKATGSTADSILLSKLRNHGVKLYADPILKATHLHVFPIDETYGERFPDWPVGQ